MPGHYNVLADLHSHLQVMKFLQKHPALSPHPENIPPAVWLP